MTPPPTLAELIFEIAAAIHGLIIRIRDDYDIEVRLRDRAANRLYYLFNQLLLIPARMNPLKVGAAFFGRTHPRRTPASGRAPSNRAPAPRPRPAPRRVTPDRDVISARQVARRLAALLQEVDDIANALRRPLTPDIQDLIEQACIQAGCDKLQTPQDPHPDQPEPPVPPSHPDGTSPPPSHHLNL